LRVLITGASGFAGRWLARACAEAGEEVLGISRSGFVADGGGSGRAVDLRDADAVRQAVRAFAPEVVYHLAALSSVGDSLEQPALTVRENVATATSMLEALRTKRISARELLAWHLERIARSNSHLNAIVTFNEEQAHLRDRDAERTCRRLRFICRAGELAGAAVADAPIDVSIALARLEERTTRGMASAGSLR